MVENKIKVINDLNSAIEELEEEIFNLRIDNSKLENRINEKKAILKEVDDFLNNQ